MGVFRILLETMGYIKKEDNSGDLLKEDSEYPGLNKKIIRGLVQKRRKRRRR